jgi:hypothetical protein
MDINPNSLETIEIILPHEGPPVIDPIREEWWRGKLRYEIERREDKHQVEMDILRP